MIFTKLNVIDHSTRNKLFDTKIFSIHKKHSLRWKIKQRNSIRFNSKQVITHRLRDLKVYYAY